MKKDNYLTLFMVATLLATNLTITTQVVSQSQQKASWRQQIRRNWLCLRRPKKNNCSKQEIARARRWVTGASAAAIAAAVLAAGVAAITLNAVLKTQEKAETELRWEGSPLYETPPSLGVSPLYETSEEGKNKAIETVIESINQIKLQKLTDPRKEASYEYWHKTLIRAFGSSQAGEAALNEQNAEAYKTYTEYKKLWWGYRYE